MRGVSAFVRSKNIVFFAMIDECRTITQAAKTSGITKQHASKLAMMLVQEGWLEKEGRKYSSTLEGKKLLKLIVPLLGYVNVK